MDSVCHVLIIIYDLRGGSSPLQKMEGFVRSSRTNTRLLESTVIPSLLLGLCPSCLSDLDRWTSTQRASVVPQQQMCSWRLLNYLRINEYLPLTKSLVFIRYTWQWPQSQNYSTHVVLTPTYLVDLLIEGQKVDRRLSKEQIALCSIDHS